MKQNFSKLGVLKNFLTTANRIQYAKKMKSFEEIAAFATRQTGTHFHAKEVSESGLFPERVRQPKPFVNPNGNAPEPVMTLPATTSRFYMRCPHCDKVVLIAATKSEDRVTETVVEQPKRKSVDEWVKQIKKLDVSEPIVSHFPEPVEQPKVKRTVIDKSAWTNPNSLTQRKNRMATIIARATGVSVIQVYKEFKKLFGSFVNRGEEYLQKMREWAIKDLGVKLPPEIV